MYNMIAPSNLQVLDLPSSTLSEREGHAALLLDMQIRKVAASLDVPTLPHQVRDALRQHGEPVRLFGENNANVRDRLRLVLARVEVLQRTTGAAETVTQEFTKATSKLEPTEAQEEAVTKYTHASEELITARDFIAQYSIQRAQKRLVVERKRRWGAKKRCRLAREGLTDIGNMKMEGGTDEEEEDMAVTLNQLDTECETLYKSLKNLALEGSQYGDGRPLSAICTSNNMEAPSSLENANNENLIATGGWSGSIKLWDGSSSALTLLRTQSQAHEDRITGIAMHAFPTNETSHLLGTASIDLTGKLWTIRNNFDFSLSGDAVKSTYEMEHVADLKGHGRRLCKISFHPSGRYVGTTSFDHTWRLWDIEAGGKELLLQDGHWKEVFGIAFHPDGSLVSTTDFASVVQLWDLRTGKSACHFLGHALRVLCAEFSPNGFQLASSGDDGTIKVWDLRQRKQYASVPAHSRLITQLKFAHNSPGRNGEFLASCSFDGLGKVWSTRDWKLLNTVRGHDGKVMGMDLLHGRQLGLVTCGYDKTLKVWNS